MASVLSEAYFHDEAAAFAALEGIMWPEGPTCPLCGNPDSKRIGILKGVRSKPSKKNPEGVERLGLHKCYQCRGQFTVRKGTVFESSHIPLHQWLQIAFLMCTSKKGVSSHQVARMLGCTVKTAWFATNRIRKAMETTGTGPMGGEGMAIEMDEKYIGKRDGVPVGKATFVSGFGWMEPKRRVDQKKIISLVERGGKARSFHVTSVNKKTVRDLLFKNADRRSILMTDEAGVYPAVGAHFADHQSVTHSAGEYGRGSAHTNTVEGFFSLFERGLFGTYQHLSAKHLHRYLAEFDFRYSNRIKLGINDLARTSIALKGAKGKRLTYKQPVGKS